MTTEAALLSVIAFGCGWAAARLLRPRGAWIRVVVGDRSRGPNADMVYRGVEIAGHKYLFTHEQAQLANERALKHWP